MTDREMNMTSEEYAELKRQEKGDVFDMLSDATQKLLSPDKLKEYADKQAQLFTHSASNVLLIMEQDPEATWVRTYDDWRQDGVTVLKGEEGIKTLSARRYRKRDGTLGMDSKVIRMFDYRQTSLKGFDIGSPGYGKVPDAIMGTYPASVYAELPKDVHAFYDPVDKLIRVQEGLDPSAKLFAVTREHAIQFLTDNGKIPREEVFDKAGMAAYILTKHYGFETPDFDFGKISAKYPGKEEKEVRSELGGIKIVCDTIDHRVQEALELSRGGKNRDDREAR